jgi:hypothetical protein
MARIKLKYVNAVRNRKPKSQRTRYYFPKRGSKTIPLPGIPGSEEFMTAYAMALNSTAGNRRQRNITRYNKCSRGRVLQFR